LSLYPSSSLILSLQTRLKSAGSEHTFLEPLIALIVDRSAEPDLYWPTMLSTLIRARLIDYLYRIAVQALPSERDSMFAIVHRAKRDALTGIMRCFQEMLAVDVGCVGPEVLEGLECLEADTHLPVTIQWQARNTLDAWIKIVRPRVSVSQ